MTTVQIALVSHGEASPGWVAEPGFEKSQTSSWEEIKAAIGLMDETRFAILLSRRADVDVLADPDALVVEYVEGYGFMLYQHAFGQDRASDPWASRSARDISRASTITLTDVLAVADTFCKGASFQDIAGTFVDL